MNSGGLVAAVILDLTSVAKNSFLLSLVKFGAVSNANDVSLSCLSFETRVQFSSVQ